MKINPAKFAREVKLETAKVSWPTRRETMVTTAIVLAISTCASVFFVMIDSLVAMVIQLILGIGG